MNSEKVKEIKEKLQEEIFIANSFGDKLRKVPTKELENLLTLINELETKNEVLCVELSRYTEHCVEMKNGTLKQFAERLKEHPIMKTYSLHNACERIPKAIDETLKEYENDTI